ncbi:MAG TPA: HepT-like ribonuclease domain-containing protein [Roseiarcus sp.]
MSSLLFTPFARRSRASRRPCEVKLSTILARIGFFDTGVQRAIEIVSEAARRIPPELQARQPNIPWAQIMGIGNVLRHKYHRVSDTLIWNVVQEYLPPLKAAIVAIEAELKKQS